MNKKCKQMMGAVLLMASFSQSGSALATSCAVPPTCEQLGYKMKVDDCGENPVLRCPFALSDDNQVYCTESAQNQVVSVGAILYGDGTVASGLVTGKTPIGIVFDTANRLAVALTDINSSGSAGSSTMIWSANYYDIPALGNCTSSTDLTTCGVDGRANTTAILNCGSSCGTTPAATATNSYEPSGCSKDFCKKTKWFLPSMRDLITLYNAKSYVNASLSLTASSGAKTLTESYYWSSTEYNNNNAWKLRMSDGNRDWNNKNNNNNYVRPVLAYLMKNSIEAKGYAAGTF